jgi:hypothetical protein
VRAQLVRLLCLRLCAVAAGLLCFDHTVKYRGHVFKIQVCGEESKQRRQQEGKFERRDERGTCSEVKHGESRKRWVAEAFRPAEERRRCGGFCGTAQGRDREIGKRKDTVHCNRHRYASQTGNIGGKEQIQLHRCASGSAKVIRRSCIRITKCWSLSAALLFFFLSLQSFWTGRAYRLAQKKVSESAAPLDLSKYAPHIIAHKALPNKVYCRRTKRILNRDREEIEKHMAGRRFKFAMTQWKPKPEKAAASAGEEGAGKAKKTSKVTSGDDDIWARMGMVAGSDLAAAEGIANEDDELQPTEEDEMEIAQAMQRQMRGEMEDSEEDDEEEEAEDEDGTNGAEDDGKFEEVPMEDEAAEQARNESGSDDNDEQEEEEEEEEAPPRKKSKSASPASAPVVAPTKGALVPKKQLQDHRPIGAPSKRDLKKEAKAAASTPAVQPTTAAAAPTPGKSVRLNASDKRKLKKQQQKQKEAAGARSASDDASRKRARGD